MPFAAGSPLRGKVIRIKFSFDSVQKLLFYIFSIKEKFHIGLTLKHIRFNVKTGFLLNYANSTFFLGHNKERRIK